VKRILTRLQFHAHNDRFDCTRDELIKLGSAPIRRSPMMARPLRHGATQFKVNFDQLRKSSTKANGQRKTSSSPSQAEPEMAHRA